MDSQLCQALRSLCFNTGWNYAIFWKLNHQAPMVLTLEDAYYDNHEHHGLLENKWSSDEAGRSCEGQCPNNSLGLALAKMSSHVYSLGEGVVGQVATTGNHFWISSDKYAADVCSLLKYYDGWLTQISAGIKTIAVVAVVPHGVVQLGSLNSITEEMKLVNHIRDTIYKLQENVAGYISSMDCSSCLFNVSCSRSSVLRNYYERIRTPDEDMKNEETDIPSSVFPSLDEIYSAEPLPEGYAMKTAVIDKNREPEKSISGVCECLDLLESSFLERLQQLNGNFASKKGGSGSSFGDSAVGSENTDNLSSLNMLNGDKSDLYNVTCANYWKATGYKPSIFHNPAQTSNQIGVLCAAGVSQMKGKMDSKRSLEFHREINHIYKCDPCLNFSAGCELHEALGPAFKKQKTEIAVQIPDEATCNSNLTTVNPCVEHLLEAVVADACRKAADVKYETTISESVKSVLTVDKVFEPPTSDTHTISSAGYSFHQSSVVEESTLHYIPTSGACTGRCPKGFSPGSYSKCNEQMERPQELRNARHGKKCRHKPRDRQLIQDRIKELRELVPNGSKCSIDSLLERTIKHMLFMQCTTEQADKLNKCAESKLVDKEIGSSSCQQGSSWVMEVGKHLRILPVMVKTIDTSGQMLIKMLCKDCSPFLEIVKTIRSLGLTILNGATEVYDGKILICYVVEGQNNRNMHRTDVLCSLLQILQQKAYV